MNRLGLVAFVFAAACGEHDHDDDQQSVAEALAALPGMHVLAVDPSTGGRTRIIADLEQAVDHTNPAAGTFQQHLVIYHLDAAAPMVLSTQGYELGNGFALAEITGILGANEVQVEHRFFGTSRPEPADFDALRTAQAAADHHQVVTTLSGFYGGVWVSTGASKGGLAALAHRRFYPDDVAGTVAYVAPYSQGLSDTRYADYVHALGVGTCGTELRAFQHDVLSSPRRAQLAATLADTMHGLGLTIDVLGADRILEITTVETPFTFWQYGSAQNCPFIPDVDVASDATVLAFIDSTNRFSLWSDQGIDADQGYWVAVAAEHGYPADETAHIASLLRYDDAPVPEQMITALAAPPAYDPAPIQDVVDWVATAGSAIVLIYGERDPWTAGAFTVSGANDTSSHTVSGGNHLSRLQQLPQATRDGIVARMNVWVGR